MFNKMISFALISSFLLSTTAFCIPGKNELASDFQGDEEPHSNSSSLQPSSSSTVSKTIDLLQAIGKKADVFLKSVRNSCKLPSDSYQNRFKIPISHPNLENELAGTIGELQKHINFINDNNVREDVYRAILNFTRNQQIPLGVRLQIVSSLKGLPPLAASSLREEAGEDHSLIPVLRYPLGNVVDRGNFTPQNGLLLLKRKDILSKNKFKVIKRLVLYNSWSMIEGGKKVSEDSVFWEETRPYVLPYLNDATIACSERIKLLTLFDETPTEAIPSLWQEVSSPDSDTLQHHESYEVACLRKEIINQLPYDAIGQQLKAKYIFEVVKNEGFFEDANKWLFKWFEEHLELSPFAILIQDEESLATIKRKQTKLITDERARKTLEEVIHYLLDHEKTDVNQGVEFFAFLHNTPPKDTLFLFWERLIKEKNAEAPAAFMFMLPNDYRGNKFRAKYFRGIYSDSEGVLSPECPPLMKEFLEKMSALESKEDSIPLWEEAIKKLYSGQ